MVIHFGEKAKAAKKQKIKEIISGKFLEAQGFKNSKAKSDLTFVC